MLRIHYFKNSRESTDQIQSDTFTKAQVLKFFNQLEGHPKNKSKKGHLLKPHMCVDMSLVKERGEVLDITEIESSPLLMLSLPNTDSVSFRTNTSVVYGLNHGPIIGVLYTKHFKVPLHTLHE